MNPTPTYETSVFVNAPFDDAYLPLLHAITFAIQECGFEMRCALESSDTGVTRLKKIEEMIADCQYSIHDLSRVQADSKRGILPRFNMPFELGLCFGAKAYGKKPKAILVMDTEPYRYQKMISDLAGQDPAAHGDDPEKVIGAVRHFLADKVPRTILLPGETSIVKRYIEFKIKLPAMAKLAKFTPDEVNTLTYWPDMLFLMKQWQYVTTKKVRKAQFGM